MDAGYNGAMLPKWICLAALSLLAACSPLSTPHTTTITPTAALEITPYRTPTPRPRPSLPVTSASPTSIPSLTPTPLTYKVVKNDDMAGIALRYGISLPALRTANPKVNPRIMSVGTVLIIPRPEGLEGTAVARSGPTPTAGAPTPVANAAPAAPTCYLAADNSVWCFVLVKNTSERGIENLSAQVLLASNTTADRYTQDAIPPINLLPAGQSMPLVAHFPPPIQAPFGANATLSSAYFIPQGDQRYLPAQIDTQETTLSAGALTAQVKGQVKLPAGGPTAQTVWVLATAYAADGQAAGVRKWAADQALQPGNVLPFELSVYSLGPEIARVELLVEARP